MGRSQMPDAEFWSPKASSKKTRIETQEYGLQQHGKAVSEGEFQKNKDWNNILCMGGRLAWTSEGEFQKNKDWNHLAFRSHISEIGCPKASSKKTRIETTCITANDYSRPGSEGEFQKNKDWNQVISTARSSRLQSEGEFQKNKDWNKPGRKRSNSSTMSEGEFQKNKDWNIPLSQSMSCFQMSEGEFQKNKDWNVQFRDLRAHDVQSEGEFQKNKDWNRRNQPKIISIYCCPKASSKKTRIETGWRSGSQARLSESEGEFQKNKDWNWDTTGTALNYEKVRRRVPKKQGLKHPHKYSIGQNSESEGEFQKNKDWNKVGSGTKTYSGTVRRRVPKKQGLKRMDQDVLTVPTSCPKASSKKTRIETGQWVA